MCTVGATETSPSRHSAPRRNTQSANTIIATQPAATGTQTATCGRSSGRPAITCGEVNAASVKPNTGVVQPFASDRHVACAGRASARAKRAASPKLQRVSACSRQTNSTPTPPANPTNEPTMHAASAGPASAAISNEGACSARSNARAANTASASNAIVGETSASAPAAIAAISALSDCRTVARSSALLFKACGILPSMAHDMRQGREIAVNAWITKRLPR